MSYPGGTILLADDEESDRFLMRRAAEEAGIGDALVEVTDGDEAIAYLQAAARDPAGATNRVPRVAILDISMQRMSGLETLQWIRRTEPWRALPVLILSASSRPGDWRVAHQLGANAYVVKPPTIEELTKLVLAIRDFWLVHTEFSLEPPRR